MFLLRDFASQLFRRQMKDLKTKSTSRLHRVWVLGGSLELTDKASVSVPSLRGSGGWPPGPRASDSGFVLASGRTWAPSRRPVRRSRSEQVDNFLLPYLLALMLVCRWMAWLGINFLYLHGYPSPRIRNLLYLDAFSYLLCQR